MGQTRYASYSVDYPIRIVYSVFMQSLTSPHSSSLQALASRPSHPRAMIPASKSTKMSTTTSSKHCRCARNMTSTRRSTAPASSPGQLQTPTTSTMLSRAPLARTPRSTVTATATSKRFGSTSTFKALPHTSSPALSTRGRAAVPQLTTPSEQRGGAIHEIGLVIPMSHVAGWSIRIPPFFFYTPVICL